MAWWLRALDPACVMACWGIAYGVGCNYNKEWNVFTPKMIARTMKQARAAIYQGYAHLDRATDVEAALIQALEKRFQAEGAHEEAVLEGWNGEYADAMRLVYQAHPDDWDVAALFAEALMNRTPWQLWDLKTGQPAEDADTFTGLTRLCENFNPVNPVNLVYLLRRSIKKKGWRPHA